jgi:hypothetical protein
LDRGRDSREKRICNAIREKNEMNNLKCLVLTAMLALGASVAFADDAPSSVGTLASPEDFFSTTLTPVGVTGRTG